MRALVGKVAYGDAPGRLTKGLARHRVPIVLLTRLGVSAAWHRTPRIRADRQAGKAGENATVRALARSFLLDIGQNSSILRAEMRQ